MDAPRKSSEARWDLAWAMVQAWPHLRIETKRFWWAAVQYTLRAGGPAVGTLAEIAVALETSTTSARRYATRLHEEGLLADPIRDGDSLWRIDPRPITAADVPSAAEVRQRRGLPDPSHPRLRTRGDRDPQLSIPFPESPPALAVVTDAGENLPTRPILPTIAKADPDPDPVSDRKRIRIRFRSMSEDGLDGQGDNSPTPPILPTVAKADPDPLSVASQAALWEPAGETPRARPRDTVDDKKLSTTTTVSRAEATQATIEGVCLRLWPGGRKPIESRIDLRVLWWFAQLLQSPEHEAWAEGVLDLAAAKPKHGERRLKNPFAYLHSAMRKEQAWVMREEVPWEFVQPLSPQGWDAAVEPPNEPATDRWELPSYADWTDAEFDNLEKFIIKRCMSVGMPHEKAAATAKAEVARYRAEGQQSRGNANAKTP